MSPLETLTTVGLCSLVLSTHASTHTEETTFLLKNTEAKHKSLRTAIYNDPCTFIDFFYEVYAFGVDFPPITPSTFLSTMGNQPWMTWTKKLFSMTI